MCMSKCQISDLRTLRAFEAAARLGSAKLAGEELHITRGAVSRLIRKLEREVGSELFDRYHRRIALNEAGRMLLGDVAAGFSHFQRAFTHVKAIRKSPTLVISVDPDFAGLLLVPRLGDFYPMAPGIRVEIIAGNRPNSLDDPRIDCAIHYAKAGLSLENGEPLFRSRLFPVCAPGRRRAALRTPEDLCHHMLLHDRSFVEWQEFIEVCATTVDVDVRSGPVFNKTAHCMEAAVRGQGVAIGDDFLAATHLSEGRLMIPFDSGFDSKNAYYFIVPDKVDRHPAVTIFRQWLLQSIDRLRGDRLSWVTVGHPNEGRIIA